MLGKKKKSQGIIDDSENSNSLFNNPFLKDYNNKSLVISLQSSKKALDEKELLLKKYKSSSDNLLKYFICIFNKLGQFSLIISGLSSEENKANHAELINQISKESKSIVELIGNVFEGESPSNVSEEVSNLLNGFLESIENKFTKLITNLLNTKIKKNEISNLINGVLNDEKIEFFSNEIIEENKSLRILLENKINLIEGFLKNPDINIFEEMKILNKKQNEENLLLNKKNEEMRLLVRRVKQKLASSPYLPFILVKDIDSVAIKNHQCICFYCGFDIEKKEEGNQAQNANNINADVNVNVVVNNTQIINNNAPCQLHEKELKPQNEDKEIKVEQKSSLISGSGDIEMKEIKENLNVNSLEDLAEKEKQAEEKYNIRNLFLNPIHDCNDCLTKNKNKDLSLNEDLEKDNITNHKCSPLLNILEKDNSSFSHSHEDQINNDEENKQNLENIYKKLYTSYLNLKLEKTISYQSLIKSKPFQILLTQIENCISTIDNQKSEILHMKKHMTELYGQISSQEKYYKFDKMKDVNLLEEKIEKLQKENSLKEQDLQKKQIEINRNEEIIKTLKNFDYGQLTSIDEFYKNKNAELIEMLKTQAKTNSEKYNSEYEKCESYEKSNLKLQMELDRFKSALNKYENVEGIESNFLFNF